MANRNPKFTSACLLLDEIELKIEFDPMKNPPNRNPKPALVPEISLTETGK
jgi:hypothetical protein